MTDGAKQPVRTTQISGLKWIAKAQTVLHLSQILTTTVIATYAAVDGQYLLSGIVAALALTLTYAAYLEMIE